MAGEGGGIAFATAPERVGVTGTLAGTARGGDAGGKRLVEGDDGGIASASAPERGGVTGILAGTAWGGDDGGASIVTVSAMVTRMFMLTSSRAARGGVSRWAGDIARGGDVTTS